MKKFTYLLLFVMLNISFLKGNAQVTKFVVASLSMQGYHASQATTPVAISSNLSIFKNI